MGFGLYPEEVYGDAHRTAGLAFTEWQRLRELPSVLLEEHRRAMENDPQSPPANEDR